MKPQIHDITKIFVALGPDKLATPEENNTTLYQRLEQDYDGFKGYELIAAHEFDCDWGTWEMHPNGDEIVILLSGKITLNLQLESGLESVTLAEQGSYVIVPKGVWHTASVTVKSKMLFITPGEGTLNKETPE